jgi:hypothetical protein
VRLAEEVAREAPTIGGSLNPTWVEWLMGFPLGWTDLRALGNAVVPQQAYPLFRAIADYERSNPTDLANG